MSVFACALIVCSDKHRICLAVVLGPRHWVCVIKREQKIEVILISVKSLK